MRAGWNTSGGEKCDNAPQPKWPQPYWDGSSLAGKTLLLYCEQGLGDALQFVLSPIVSSKVVAFSCSAINRSFRCYPRAAGLTSSFLSVSRFRNLTHTAR